MRILLTEESCKSNEVPLGWSTGPVEPPPPPPPPPGGGTALRVVNALGVELGPLLGSSVAVLTLPNGARAYAELFPVNAPANWQLAVYYQAPNCAGEGFVSWGTLEELVTPAIVRRAGVWALRPGSLAKRPVTSYHLVGDEGAGACQAYASTIDSWAFDFYAPADLGIVYPLSVQ